MVAGSANLTAGGLRTNWEASFRTEDNGALARKFGQYLDGLIESKEIVAASQEAIRTTPSDTSDTTRCRRPWLGR